MSLDIVEDGQFDDAPEDHARGTHHYIDDHDPNDDLAWSESEEGEESDSDGDLHLAVRAEDEDWEIAERGAVRVFPAASIELDRACAA